MQLPKVPLTSPLWVAEEETSPINLWAGRRLRENSCPVRDEVTKVGANGPGGFPVQEGARTAPS